MTSVDTILGMSPIEFISKLIVLFTAMPIHEYAHGRMADRLGDPTPSLSGRLTLNPFAHLSLIGSISLVFLGFGWAKPVRIDPRNFKNYKRDTAFVAAAGPLSNVLISLLSLIIMKLVIGLASTLTMPVLIFLYCLETMFMINLWLAVFNLLPIPPLDGSKIIGFFIPNRYYQKMMQYQQVFNIALIVLLYVGVLSTPLMWLAGHMANFLNFITRPIDLLTKLIAG